MKPLHYCKGFFVLSTILISFNSYAQFFDSIEVALTHKPTLDLKLESRNSFFANEWALISGIRVGLNFNETFKTGLGYSWLRKEIRHEISVDGQNVQADYFFHYGTVYGEYTFYDEKPFSMTIFASIGGGRAWDRYIDNQGERQTANSSFVFVYEPYMTGMVDVLKYFKVGAGMGFRIALSDDKYSRQKLNTLIYVFKLQVKISDIMDDMVRK